MAVTLLLGVLGDRRRLPGGGLRASPLLLAVVLAARLLTPAAAAAGERELLVAAASDLIFALREIVPAFERAHRARVRLTLGSTGQLAQQIEHGAPFDVFFAANRDHVEVLRAAGRLRTETVRPYARGILVLAAPPGREAFAGLPDLLDARVRRVALANPAHAPYGMAAREALARAGLWDRLQPKLVYGESVSQAQQFLRTGNVDAALLARSVIHDSGMWHVPVEHSLYRPLIQWAAVTAGSRQPELAAALIGFIASPPGQAMMARFGFLSPQEH